ncbi:MAG: GTPase ObgE [Nitrospirae bacterium]|nr:GTPase ObgE [Nitrospirota bacterium]MBI5096069.1 GTPase ObgE [Nitrospirota bacterium]
MFIDRIKIYVQAGNGGNGCVSFRREKYVPRGGPNGGKGGKGGSIIIKASSELYTLLDQKYHQHYVGPRGAHGEGKDRYGREGKDVIVRVPVGTIVCDFESKALIADLVEEGQEVIVAQGGRGGLGNAAFATSVNRAPKYAQPGEKGEARWLLLELKLLADVGIIGLPNAGKSTLISCISAARPKIADYPFTTLSPNLGVVSCGKYKSFVMADIPGLIEGAHEGKGLGFQFLRHVERTSILLHLVDISDNVTMAPVEALETINKELGLYSPLLLEKPQVVAGTKIDAMTGEKTLKQVSRYCKKQGFKFFPVSAVTGKGINELVRYLGKEVEKHRDKQKEDKSNVPIIDE